MRTAEFDNQIIQPLSEHLGDQWALDLYHAYNDAQLICEEIRALEGARPVDQIVRPDISDAERIAAIRASTLTSVLLKCIYMLGDIFISKFIGALHGAEWMSMNTFVLHGEQRYRSLRNYGDTLPSTLIISMSKMK